MDESTVQATTQSEAEASPLANPALLQLIGSMLNTAPTAATPEAAEKSATAPAGDSVPTALSASTDGLSALLSDPAFLAKLPQMMEMLKPLLAAGANATVPAMSTGDLKQPKPAHACRDDLLLALKPFLSKERASAVDTIIRLSRLGSVLGSMK